MKLDILAFGAHPDDVELGCSGTILKEISLGKTVGIIDLTHGELGTRGSAEIRDQEAKEAAKIALKANAKTTLETKALQLTGGPESAKPPKDRNPYAWVMENKQADVFLTYCTNAVLAQKEVPSLKIVDLPPELAVGADYGLLVLKDANSAAAPLAEFILSPEGQAILTGYGFQPPKK